MAEAGGQNVLLRRLKAEQLPSFSATRQASGQTCTLYAFITDSLQLGSAVH